MPSKQLPSILLIGCGHMGGALWRGWLRHGIAPSVIVDRHLEAVPAGHHICRKAADISADFKPDYIILAVKPARMEETLREIAPWIGDAVIISVLAGRSIADLRGALPRPERGNPIIRAMPNTPSEIGQGVTGAYGVGLSDAQRGICDALLATVGVVLWLDREDEIEILTPLSGSGPAYVFLFAELLEQEAVARGLTPEVARILARHTVAGAGALLATSEEDSATLRRNVTSPHGVTQAALNVFMRAHQGMKQLVSEAIAAGLQRTRELSRPS
ncbi:pyrroline-5-carboxylate reductase [Candidatus Kirkpatrickella diaphorinae]|uniref:Pyrroline-5-carboxylate reductase n=1 Tax=Candidatus Kirkpatrickella diaphorinae TaxID=2984322 RepID=A0ABY6GKS0_9PROT|nr:pyrroline-5-carboxylate reductase [Candidatus Kirkpatrickella diaphorinae]UYH51343.1 pyrroline-5-carboxylate reductase [Candidatus Kirkpatrickella diaphorinae]